MFKINFKIAIITFLFLTQSIAAITIGRNGGGLAELEFVTIGQSAKLFLNFCLADQSKCKLNLEMQKLLPHVINYLSTHEISWGYSADQNSVFSFSSEKKLVLIKQSYLYDENLMPKSTDEIVKLSIYAAYVAYDSKVFAEDEFIKVQDQINFNLIESSRSLTLAYPDLKLHHLSFTNSESDFLLLENYKESLDLTKLIKENLTISGLKVENITWDDINISLEVKFLQKNKKFSGLILINPKLMQTQSGQHDFLIYKIKLVNMTAI